MKSVQMKSVQWTQWYSGFSMLGEPYDEDSVIVHVAATQNEMFIFDISGIQTHDFRLKITCPSERIAKIIAELRVISLGYMINGYSILESICKEKIL